ncbi:BQ5605_C017g08444 [Microbotryum silenes-dioicae]|uniref:BQ5605_C017g08444 protein n=1 Tax=Microbotryum silenes-dioicae TaxID=796604 RepID=A0A2X0LZC2_9BASI|nr:BQ5605_C017g08444 [Microbotryum silenes-dioicae]
MSAVAPPSVVKRSVPGTPSHNGGGDTNPGNNLHVSGLSTRVEDRDLDEVFAKFGRIAKCQVVRDPHSKESRGFAFVTMETPEEADAAIAGLNATELMGRTMNVQHARRGRARTPTPGQYHGPPKRDELPPRGSAYGSDRGGGGYDRGYDRSGYGGGGGGGYGGRGGSYHDDRRPPPPPAGYGAYDDRRGGGGYDSYAQPMRRYDDRRRDDYPPVPPRDRRYDDRERYRY